MQQGLGRVYPDRRDYSVVHTYGATIDPKGLPSNFSIYDGRPIPNQNDLDERFNPPIRPLPFGCTGESQTFSGGLADGAVYVPDDFYFATPPGTDNAGRDIRASLQTAITYGFRTSKSAPLGNKRKAYFNCYGAGKISDYDAVKIALWVNQSEKRAVSVGSWWYWGFVDKTGIPAQPSFNIRDASLHNWIVTGWITINGVEYLECIPWCGQKYGHNGIVYMTNELFNALMSQPYTGAFTMTKDDGTAPIAVGWQAVVDHFVYWFRSKFGV